MASITGFKAHHFQEIFADYKPQLWAESYVFKSQRTLCSDPRFPPCFLRFTEQALVFQLGEQRDQGLESGEGRREREGRLKLSRCRRTKARYVVHLGQISPSRRSMVQVLGRPPGPTTHCFSDIGTLPTPAWVLCHVLLVGCVPHVCCIRLPGCR